MKKFAKYVTLFLIGPMITYMWLSLYILPDLIEKTQGPSTSFQVNKSFKNALSRQYELLILGNSGLYRGVNPDSLAYPSYNFAHDNDSYNQMYYKLRYLDKNKKSIKYLVVGIDYFQFSFISDTRNYIYSPLLGEEYDKDYSILSSNFFSFFLQNTNILKVERLRYLKDLNKHKRTSIYLKDNGQYIRPGIAKVDDSRTYHITRQPLQAEYFEKILNYCKEKHITVFLCMVPCRKNALDNYTQKDITEFTKFINSHTSATVHFIDYSHQPGWKLEDYTDIAHLTEKAANKFSKQLSDTLVKIIEKKSDAN